MGLPDMHHERAAARESLSCQRDVYHYKSYVSEFPSTTRARPMPVASDCYVNEWRSLRSCDGYKAIVPRAYKVRLGDRAFSIIGPKLWNSLPITIRSAPSISIFKSLLKTHLFRFAYH